MQLLPQKSNREPENDGSQSRNLLLQGAPIFRFHVCFQGCIIHGSGNSNMVYFQFLFGENDPN